MTTNQILLAIAAGLIAAVVFASATTGPMPIRFVLFFLTPLSLYLVGLGVSPAAGTVAASVATLTILLITNPVAAVVFAACAGLPAAYTTQLALLGRQENGQVVEWYPIGRILLAAAIFAGLFAAFAIVALGANMDELTKTARSIVESFAKTEMPQLPGAKPLTEEQITEIGQRIIGLMPATLAALSLITTLLNLWLAGRITKASGRLTRPWPDLATTTLPGAATLMLLVAMAAAFLQGVPGLVAGGFAGALMLAFAIIGLAVAHYVTRGSPWRGFALGAIYFSIAFMTPIILLLTIVGLADTIFSFRARRQRPPGPES